MKKFLFLVIVILGLFTIDHPSIKEPREALLSQGITILSESSKVKKSPAAKRAREAVIRTVVLSAEEQTYVNDAFATDDKLKAFHLRYCKENDMNLYLYGLKLSQVCIIASDELKRDKDL